MNKEVFLTSVKIQSNAVGKLGINLASYLLHFHLKAHFFPLSALRMVYIGVKMKNLKLFIYFHEKSRQIGLDYAFWQEFKSDSVKTVLHLKAYFLIGGCYPILKVLCSLNLYRP